MDTSKPYGGENQVNLQILENTVKELFGRVVELERAVGLKVSPITPLAPPAAQAALVIVTPLAQLTPLAPPVLEPEEIDAKKLDAKADTTSMESQIGLYWLSRLGIGFLVMGVALFLMYSFNSFGPFAKLATGFAAAAALLTLGEVIEKRDNMPWYARLIEGGAWTMCFFTTYAMHHVQSVKVISDPLVDLALLLGVAGMAVGHAASKKSEIMAIFAITLGFVTLGLSHMTGFTAAASTVLVVLAVFLSARFNWLSLYAYSVIASYAAVVSGGILEQSVSPSSFVTLLFALLPSLFGFGLAPHYLTPATKAGEKALGAITTLNNLLFAMLFFPHASHILGTAASVAYLWLAAWFFLLGYLYRHNKITDVAPVHGLSGLLCVTSYFFAADYGDSTWPALAIELLAIVYIGLRHKLWSFRRFAVILALFLGFADLVLALMPNSMLVFGQRLPVTLITSGSTILAFLGAAALYRNKKITAQLPPTVLKFGFHFYFNSALIFAWILPLSLCNQTFQAIGKMPEDLQTPILLATWTVVAAFVLSVGRKLKMRYMQAITAGMFMILAVPILAPEHFNWVSSTLATAAIYIATAIIYFGKKSATKDETSQLDFQTHYLIAYAVTAGLPHAAAWHNTSHVAFLCILSVLNLFIGERINNTFVRGLTPLLLLATAVCNTNHTITFAVALPMVLTMFGLWGWHRYLADFDKQQSSHMQLANDMQLCNFYSIAAGFVLAAALAFELHNTWISCAWAVQGLVTLLVGFIARDKVMRVSGLTLFAALTARLFCIDLAGAETIYRVSAFTVTGLILLVSAYLYNHFERRLTRLPD